MDWIKCLRQAIEILTFRRDTIRVVADDPTAFLPGLSFVALFGFIGTLHQGFPAVAFDTMVAVAGSFLFAGILYLGALIFGGKGRYLGLWQPLAFTSIADMANILLIFSLATGQPMIHSITKILILLVAFYKLVVGVFILEVTMDLTLVRAILVVLIVFFGIPLLMLLSMGVLTEGSSLAPFIFSIF